jgi:hypothetical protein
MKRGQWVIILNHEDSNLIGKLGVICSPLWWRDKGSKDVDVQVNDTSTTFVNEDDLSPVSFSKETRQRLVKLYDWYWME